MLVGSLELMHFEHEFDWVFDIDQFYEFVVFFFEIDRLADEFCGFQLVSSQDPEINPGLFDVLNGRNDVVLQHVFNCAHALL